MTYTLGISAYYHDSAAALLHNGTIVAAAQEERFTRKKGDSAFPHHAISCCLDRAGIGIDAVAHIVFYENHFVKFERLLETYMGTAPASLKSFLKAMPTWLTQNVWLEKEICRELGVERRIDFCDHHLSHASSAFFPSPFDEAAILTIDGVGEWSSTTWGVGKGNSISLQQELRFPDSLGLLYSAFTFFTGFKINSGEYKLMGLAPYGKPRYVQTIMTEIMQVADSGAISLNQKYFDYMGGLAMTNAAFADLFDGPPRQPESKITQREMDIAASIQAVTEEVVLRMARYVRAQSGLKHVVLAGGVALNVVACGVLSRQKIFDKLWVQPASGDAGGALGAALWHWHTVLQQPRCVAVDDDMQGAFLGPEIPSASEADDALLRRLGGVWESLDDEVLQGRVADLLAQESIVAVARGRMEWGPRALGARSILGDARSERMQKHMNLRIKFRESFRPFAPMVLEEDVYDWFGAEQESPYMLLVYPVLEKRRIPLQAEDAGRWGIDLLNVPRSEIPAVTHVDYSARLQTIDKKRNPFIYGVLSAFKAQTSCPVIINTSFNVRGEPIVCTCEDAYRCFMATDIDALVVGNRLFVREQQHNKPLDDASREQWLRRFDLD
ncbi:MAG: carbamoyltransferase [Desulfovibrionaceae bacterium]